MKQQILILLLVATATTLSAQLNTEYADAGTIAARVVDSCQIEVWTVKGPDHKETLSVCAYEWSYKDADGWHSGAYFLVDCENPDTFYMPMVADSQYIRKYVSWHPIQGTQQEHTNKVWLRCEPQTEDISNDTATTLPPDTIETQTAPEVVPFFTADIEGLILSVVSEVPGVWVVLDPMGWVVIWGNFEPGSFTESFNNLAPGFYFVNVLFQVGGKFEEVTLKVYI